MNLSSTQEAALERFIAAWGSMAALFGFNPSTARVSALLIAAAEPLSLNEIAERLEISRGNASMCLKELRGWGVARRVPRAGDRRDFYESDGDLWKMAISIARERKRREFDPVVGEALAALTDLGKGAEGAAAERVADVESFLQALERVGKQVLENEVAALSLISLLRSSFGGAKS